MNTIKYRQWLKYGRFHYWGYLKDDVFVAPCGPNDAAAPSEKFTGLYDKNGVEIYEGDVLGYEGFEGSIDHAEVCWHQGFLAWMVDDHSGRGMISLCDLNDDDTNQFNSDEVEVIGNIHENPELMEANHDHS